MHSRVAGGALSFKASWPPKRPARHHLDSEKPIQNAEILADIPQIPQVVSAIIRLWAAEATRFEPVGAQPRSNASTSQGWPMRTPPLSILEAVHRLALDGLAKKIAGM
jgi:hypothetical protein